MAMELALPRDFHWSGVTCGIKESGKPDLALFISSQPCAAAGVFTQNRVAGAPVVVSRSRLPGETVRGVVINSGNSNACTGERGIADARHMTALTAEKIGCKEEQILVCSTGVIGRFLPMDKIESGIREAATRTGHTAEHLTAAARAIMTTDTVEKISSRTFEVNGQTVTVAGVCKGAAMIAPNMATMLAVVMTDARISAADARELISAAAGESFNCISVDGHTSTSDSVLLLANGASQVDCSSGPARAQFQAALAAVCGDLARKIIRDAEGATHFVTVRVQGMASESDCRLVAKAVCDSPLVKTAIAGNDPNWGRIVSAAGYAGVPFREEELSLVLNNVVIYEAGRPLAVDAAAVSASMKQGEVTVDLQFRLGKSSTTYWTCDLTAEYVRLNADYTT